MTVEFPAAAKLADVERLSRLGDNSFARLATLLADISPPADRPTLSLSVGEPQHAPPDWLQGVIEAHASSWNQYPPIGGTKDLNRAIAEWSTRRFSLPPGMIDPARHVLPLAGTKEGLYLIAQAAVPERKAGGRPAVLLPNPFYHAYLAAAVMSGADPVFLSATAERGFLPDFETLTPAELERVAVAFFCSPANPQGAIASLARLRSAIRLAREYGFLLVVDECYSEIYDSERPPGALEAAASLGGSLDNVVVFNSLSKRSNAAGLRVGSVVGDAAVIARFLRLRAYCGPQIPLPLQAAGAALWRDEAHVAVNRARYRTKIDLAARIIGDRYGFYRPAGGFFLWLDVGDSEAATRHLWREAGVRVLPGAYISATDDAGLNPGANYLRVALVHDEPILAEALERLSAGLA